MHRQTKAPSSGAPPRRGCGGFPRHPARWFFPVGRLELSLVLTPTTIWPTSSSFTDTGFAEHAWVPLAAHEENRVAEGLGLEPGGRSCGRVAGCRGRVRRAWPSGAKFGDKPGLVMMSRCRRLSRQPFFMKSLASQSSSSGWLGFSPSLPKSPGVSTRPRPKWCSQKAVDEHPAP